MNNVNLSKYKKILDKSFVRKYGIVSEVIGLTILSKGPDVSIGNICYIKKDKFSTKKLMAEVVGFKNNNVMLMPLGIIEGLGPGYIVEIGQESISIKISENMIGKVLDGLGKPMFEEDEISKHKYEEEFAINNKPPNPMSRNRIKEKLNIGVKAIDGLLSLGKGQRVGIFAGSGVGKSTLLGMISRNTNADLSIIALIGERGREVKEFIEKDLGPEGLKKSILVIATSDQPALLRLKAAEVSTAIAEYFRQKGKTVILLMDSLTRYAMAQREIGLATGEPPVSKGYTPSVFAMLPKLLERAGNSDVGSITGIYTVLVDGDDLTEPITDTARGILDGHIVLSRKIASKNHYPAIDVLASISRVMSDIVDDEHKNLAKKIKKYIATYNEAEDLINIGAYVKGSNSEIDQAIEKHNSINKFLTQDTHDNVSFEQMISYMKEICD